MNRKLPVVERTCVECGKPRPEKDFGITNGYRRHICKKCRSKMMRKSRRRKSLKDIEMPWWIERKR